MKKVLIVVAVIFVLLFAACAVVVGVAVEEPDQKDSVTSSAPEPSTKDKVTKPKKEKSELGQTFPTQVGNWEILNPPKIKEAYGSFDVADLIVTNTSDSNDSPMLDLTLTNGNTIVANFSCIGGGDIPPGMTQKIECISFDDWAKWTEMEIKNTF